MSYFNMSKSELQSCAACGDRAAQRELQRRQMKNNPAAAAAVMDTDGSPVATRAKRAPIRDGSGTRAWAEVAARREAEKAAKRATWSPSKLERMARVKRVMNFAQHLIRENGWFPGTALKVAWEAEKDGKLENYSLRAKVEVPETVVAKLRSQAADPAFLSRGTALAVSNPRGGARREKRSAEDEIEFDYSYGL